MLLHDAYMMFLDRQQARGCSPATMDTYRLRVGGFVKAHRRRKLDGLTPEDVDRHFLALKQRGLAEGTLAGHKRAMRAFFNWLLAERMIEDDPAAVLTDSKKHRYSFRPVHSTAAPRNDMLAVLEALPHFAAHRDYRPRDVRDAALVALAADSAGRRGELRNVRRRAVLEALRSGEPAGGGRMIYSVRTSGKTGPAELRFTDEAAGLLRRWIRMMEDPELFKHVPVFLFVSTRTGRRLRLDSMRLALGRICAFADVPAFGWHAIRKRTVTDLIVQTGDVKMGQALAGHKDMRTTERYYWTADEDRLVAAAAELASARWGRPQGQDLADQLFGGVKKN